MQRFGFGIGLVLAVVATPIGAQGWTRLPNGELGYVTDYTSSGFFHCNNYFINAHACTVNGQSVTLSNGGNTLTLTYTGFQNQIVASAKSQRIPIGQITKTTTGSGPFVFPTTKTPNAFYLAFNIFVAQTAPVTSVNWWSGGYLMKNNNLLPVNYGGHTVLAFGVAPPPPPATYTMLVMEKFTNPKFDLGDEDPMLFDAGVTVTPEPATLLLVGSGLAGVFGAVARRRRRT